MIIELIYTSVFAALIGVAIGYLISKNKTILRLLIKEEKYKHQVISNPDLLLEKLKKNPPIISDGQIIKPEFEYNEDGSIKDFKREDLLIEDEKVAHKAVSVKNRPKIKKN